LHDNNIIHGNLTTETIYVNDDGSVKIGNYGVNDQSKGKCGDVYMLGCILYSLLTFRNSPLLSASHIPSSSSVFSSDLEFDFGAIGKCCSIQLKMMLRNMLDSVCKCFYYMLYMCI
jgi:serine/threonine protein kinase